jgi:hypothetical protein
MKTKNIVAVILLIAFAMAVPAQDKLKVIKSNIPVLKLQHGERTGRWRLLPDKDPDIDEVPVPEGAKVQVTFTSDVESISFTVEIGSQFDFVIEYDGKKHNIRVVGVKAP